MDKYFPVLAQGQRSSAPPRTLQGDGYLWRDSMNWIVRDGQLKPNLSVDGALSVQPSVNLPGSEDEIGLWLSTASPSGGDWMAVVTDRSIFVYPNPTTGWVDCTPTYTTGTVTVTNGSTAVGGAGTAWSARGITAGQHMVIDGNYVTIASVNSDISTTLTANYPGATGGGKAYVLIRNFIGGGLRNSVRNPHVVLYNETLYVAGTYLGSANGAVAPAVIKVANVYSATPTTTYITGASALSVGLDFIAGLTRISGIHVLQDSRVVFTGNSNQVFYSSPTSDTVWTVTPGGSVVLTDIAGQHRALGEINDTLTVHHARGIVLGRPTGLSDPPLTWARSGATRGAVSSASLKQLNGVELYLSQDGDVKIFDLNRSFSAGNGEMRLRLTGGGLFSPSTYATFFAATDEGRNLYRLFRFGGTGNPQWIYELDTDRWWPGSSGAHILGGCSDILEASSVTQTTRHIVSKSARSFDLLWYYREDDTAVYDSSTSVLLDTDDLDFDAPLTYKALHRVVLWYTCTNTTGVRVAARVEGGSWVNAPTQNLASTSSLSEGVAYFDFVDLISAGRQIRVRIEVPTPATGCAFSPTALLIRAEPCGEVERA